MPGLTEYHRGFPLFGPQVIIYILYSLRRIKLLTLEKFHTRFERNTIWDWCGIAF